MPGPATFRTELRVAPDGKIKMVFAPPGLIQTIWLQLAFAMCADAKLFRCEPHPPSRQLQASK
jgi:hypothetical protein